jgi:hypothetical protein
MARAGQQVVVDEGGLADRISVGVLAKAFPRASVEAVIDAAAADRWRRVPGHTCGDPTAPTRRLPPSQRSVDNYPCPMQRLVAP